MNSTEVSSLYSTIMISCLLSLIFVFLSVVIFRKSNCKMLTLSAEMSKSPVFLCARLFAKTHNMSAGARQSKKTSNYIQLIGVIFLKVYCFCCRPLYTARAILIFKLGRRLHTMSRTVQYKNAKSGYRDIFAHMTWGLQ